MAIGFRRGGSRHLAGLDDETVRGRAEIVEGIASHQGQFGRVARLEDAYILGFDDLGGFYAVLVVSAKRFKPDNVIITNFPKAAKQGIAVAGHGDVSGLA